MISAVVFVFTFPALYSRNKSTVDNAIREKTACLRQRVGTLTRDAQKNVQPVINTLIEKSGPVGEFVKKNLNNTRTAGSTVGDSKATSFNTDADRATSGATTGASTTSTSANSRTLHPGVKTATVPVVVPVSIPVKVTTNPFPNVPTSNLNRNDVDQIAHDLRNDTRN